MSKTYQIKMTAPKVEAKTLDATPGAGKAPITLKAQPGARYHLTDTQSGFAPDNIRISRSGKNLKIFTDGVNEPTFIVEDFYEQPADNRAALTGKSEDGNNYEYIPENASGTAAAPVLKDDGQIFGMALGGEVINAGAAVGLLAPVAAFNPLLLAGGALGAAAAGGGGGGSDGGTASTVYAKLGSVDTGPQGDNITSDQTPSIVGKATPKSTITVTVNNKEYTGTADDSGNFEIPVTDDLPQGRYVPKVVAKLNNTVTDNFEGTPFIIDLSQVNNIDNSNGADPAGKADPNASVVPNIVSINVDSGDTTDFYTNKGGNKGLKFLGTATGMAIDSQDWIELALTQPDNTVLKDYVKPDKNGNWIWDKLSTDLADGKYTLNAKVVDGAGNVIRAANPKVIVIDSTGGTNIDPSDGSKGNDPNVNASILISSISDDSGPSASDFVTNDHTLVFKGSLSNFTTAGYGTGDRVLVQVLDSSKAVKISGYATLSNGSWTLDSTATTLPNGSYTIKAAIVDKADNVIVAANEDKVLTIQDQIASSDPNKNASGSVSSVTDDDGWLPNDFVTSDTTPTVNGVVKDFTPNGDKVLVQILDKNSKPVAETYADPVNGQWVFNNTTALPDGNYTIQPAIVDTAGNIVKTIPPQPLVIDSNAKLKLAISSMTDDTGTTASDWITKDTQPVFSGNFGTGKTWTPNDGVFLAQIYDSTGKLVGSYGNSVIASNGATWTTTESGINLADGHYTLRTSIKASNGQVHDVAEKQFTIDSYVVLGSAFDGSVQPNTNHYSVLKLQVSESVDFELREHDSKKPLKQGKFDGTTLEITSLVTKDYLGADVELILTDSSGNTKIIDLASNYFLDSQTTLTFEKAGNFSNQTTDFNTLSTYKLSAKDLDLTTLIPTNPATATSTTAGSRIIVNDLNMSDASAQVVTISLNDVLQLGSTNAFDKSGNYSGDLQMRVSGTDNDTVRLFSSDGWKLVANTVVQLPDDPSNAASTQHGYRVYTDSTGRVDLFIQQDITQVNFL